MGDCCKAVKEHRYELNGEYHPEEQQESQNHWFWLVFCTLRNIILEKMGSNTSSMFSNSIK
jgi:hypothetical protein